MKLNPTAKFERMDHHGIVAGVLHDIGFFSVAGESFPDQGGEEISDGQAIAAMILNGLGFTDNALSLTEEFFELLPTEKLLGEGVTPENLNRHKLSRALDKIYEFGCSEFFSLVASRAVMVEGVESKYQSLDTSSFSLTGAYDRDSDTEAIEIVRGHSKDHRPDLKQVVAELIVAHDGDVPLALKMHSGNASDSLVFKNRCDELVNQFDASQCLMADSKLYSANNSKNLARIRFVTRIPEVLKEAKAAISEAINVMPNWYDSDRKISIFSIAKSHYNIDQMWHICLSKESLGRAVSSVKRNVEREKSEIEKALFHLQAKRFNCIPDAIQAYEAIGKKVKYHTLNTPVATSHNCYAGRGKPKKDAVPERILIQIKGCATENHESIVRIAHEKACFIVGTNNIDQTAEQAVAAYKSQSSVERGFRFLKDPTFFAQSLYLKKPERIEALVTVMTLALLIYSIAQRRIRKAIADQKPFVPNSSKKPYKNPTLRRIFQLFQGINLISELHGGYRQYLIQGLKELHSRILQALGGKALELYS